MSKRTGAWIFILLVLPLFAIPAVGGKPGVPIVRRLEVFGQTGGSPVLKSPLALVRDDRSGDLLATSFETGRVVIFNRAGAVLKTLGSEAGLATPYGIALTADGKILVSEISTGMLKVLSPAGTLLDAIDLSLLRGSKVAPGRVTVGSDGSIAVVDLLNREILLLGSGGELLKTFGPLEYPQKAVVSKTGRILAVSSRGSAVRVFDRSGNKVAEFGGHGDVSPMNVSFPTGLDVDRKGRIWIADAFQHRLKVFSGEGKFLFNFGRLEEKEKGGFFFPVDLRFGPDGLLFVLEKGAGRIQVFQVEDLKAPGEEER